MNLLRSILRFQMREKPTYLCDPKIHMLRSESRWLRWCCFWLRHSCFSVWSCWSTGTPPLGTVVPHTPRLKLTRESHRTHKSHDRASLNHIHTIPCQILDQPTKL